MKEDIYVHEGQMTVYDCIEVAETGSDGVLNTPLARAQALRDGRVVIEERCPHCESTSLQEGEVFMAHCIPCGREIPLGLVRAYRKTRIRKYLVEGVI